MKPNWMNLFVADLGLRKFGFLLLGGSESQPSRISLVLRRNVDGD